MWRWEHSDVKKASGAGAGATEKGRDEPKPGWEEIKDTNVSRDQKQESVRNVGGGGFQEAWKV